MTKRKREDDEEPTKNSAQISKVGHWALGLLKTMEDPKFIIESDDLVTVIKDAYPKAEFHYLVLPKEDISNLKALTEDHVDLLKHMEKKANEIIKNARHKNHNFKLGYHAQASMFRLHLHVISDDMNSACIKTKKHWNSYNTDFFLDSKEVRKTLKRNGKVTLPSKDICKSLMDTPLKCHKCSYIPKHMPDLKKHILIHLDEKLSE